MRKKVTVTFFGRGVAVVTALLFVNSTMTWAKPSQTEGQVLRQQRLVERQRVKSTRRESQLARRVRALVAQLRKAPGIELGGLPADRRLGEMAKELGLIAAQGPTQARLVVQAGGVEVLVDRRWNPTRETGAEITAALRQIARWQMRAVVAALLSNIAVTAPGIVGTMERTLREVVKADRKKAAKVLVRWLKTIPAQDLFRNVNAVASLVKFDPELAQMLVDTGMPDVLATRLEEMPAETRGTVAAAFGKFLLLGQAQILAERLTATTRSWREYDWVDDAIAGLREQILFHPDAVVDFFSAKPALYRTVLRDGWILHVSKIARGLSHSDHWFLHGLVAQAALARDADDFTRRLGWIQVTEEIFGKLVQRGALNRLWPGTRQLVKMLIYSQVRRGVPSVRMQQAIETVLPLLRRIERLERRLPTAGIEIHRVIYPNVQGDEERVWVAMSLASYFLGIEMDHEMPLFEENEYDGKKWIDMKIHPTTPTIEKLMVELLLEDPEMRVLGFVRRRDATGTFFQSIYPHYTMASRRGTKSKRAHSSRKRTIWAKAEQITLALFFSTGDAYDQMLPQSIGRETTVPEVSEWSRTIRQDGRLSDHHPQINIVVNPLFLEEEPLYARDMGYLAWLLAVAEAPRGSQLQRLYVQFRQDMGDLRLAIHPGQKLFTLAKRANRQHRHRPPKKGVPGRWRGVKWKMQLQIAMEESVNAIRQAIYKRNAGWMRDLYGDGELPGTVWERLQAIATRRAGRKIAPADRPIQRLLNDVNAMQQLSHAM